MSTIFWGKQNHPTIWGIGVNGDAIDVSESVYKEMVYYGYSKPFYWIQLPDGQAKRMITRGKMLAMLAVIRMNYPDIHIKQIGSIPEPKRKNK